MAIAIPTVLGTTTAGRAVPPDATAAVGRAIHALTLEAQQARRDGVLPRNDVDFADGVEDPVDGVLVARKLPDRLHRDPFIDAYVRWQLTGFVEALPDIADRRFDRMLEDLPPLLENPRADVDLIRTLTAAQEYGPMPWRTRQRFEEILETMRRDAALAESFNRPALHLRAWLGDQFDDDPARTLLLQLETCGALLVAGWPVDEAKQRTEAAFEAAGLAGSIDDESARRLAERARPLQGANRLFIRWAAVTGDDTMAASFELSAIHDFDVRRWLRSLDGPMP